jgi:hypothetical protein
MPLGSSVACAMFKKIHQLQWAVVGHEMKQLGGGIDIVSKKIRHT